jgi:F-type H+-transporting ATPase subunit b
VAQVFEVGTFLASIVSFLIVFWIIAHFGFKPFANILRKRSEYIESQINDSERARTEAEKVLAEQRKLLDEARQDAKNLLDAARVRADEQAREIIRDAQAEAGRLLEEGRALIERDRAEALNGVLEQVAALTVELTSKLLHNHVSPAVHEDMLAEAEKRLGELVC